MSKAKHTPGPWEVFDNGLIFVKKDGHPICGCGTSFVGGGGECADWQVERNKANANLIAAAPEMLDALETCCMAMQGERKAYCDCFQQGDMHSLDMDGNCAFSKTGKCRIWKAIQKARGQG
jgi:hypothetical protein